MKIAVSLILFTVTIFDYCSALSASDVLHASAEKRTLESVIGNMGSPVDLNASVRQKREPDLDILRLSVGEGARGYRNRDRDYDLGYGGGYYNRDRGYGVYNNDEYYDRGYNRHYPGGRYHGGYDGGYNYNRGYNRYYDYK